MTVAAVRAGVKVASTAKGGRHTRNLRDAKHLVNATIETAARDLLTVDRDTLREAVLRWFEPRADEQTSGGFDPARPPSADVEMAVDSAINLAFSSGGKVADVRGNVAIGRGLANRRAKAVCIEKLSRRFFV